MNGGNLPAAAVSTVETDEHHEMALVGADGKLITIEDRNEQAFYVLKSDLMAKLNKEVKSLDQDSWMFDGPRSRINLISGPGGLRHRRIEIPTRRDLAQQK